MKSIPKPNIKEPEMGSTVALFVDNFNPPTMDHFRAIEALLKRDEIKSIWLCPLSGDEHVKAMINILALDFSIRGNHITSCSVAIDKGIKEAKEVLEKVRSIYPFFNFKLASIAPLTILDSQHTFFIKIGKAHITEPQGTITINLENILPSDETLLLRLKNGEDVSRHFIKPIWAYIQKHKLYR